MILTYIKTFFKSDYFRQNKPIILILFAWLFRLCFLLQGNAGGVSLNGFVLLQIALILTLFAILLSKGFYPILLLQLTSTRLMALIYLLGMLSLVWSVLPLMSCFFAFENLVIMTTLLYLAYKTNSVYQLERFFIGFIIAILIMFFIRTILLGGGYFHSVTYSTVAAMLTTYCLGEWKNEWRPEENNTTLRFGLFCGVFFLIITTSGGAIFSTFLSCFAIVAFTKNQFIRFLAFFFIGIFACLWFLGDSETVLSFLFPGKSTASITSAHGRTIIWNMIYEKIAERPWLGWGYAAVERVLPQYCTDAHNSLIGIRGSLGNIGCCMLIMTMLSQLVYLFHRTYLFGFKGLLIATICAFINSNTTAFLGAKASASALTFQFLLVLGAAYTSLPLVENSTRNSNYA